MSPTTFYFARFSRLIFHFLARKCDYNPKEENVQKKKEESNIYLSRRLGCSWQAAQGTINHGQRGSARGEENVTKISPDFVLINAKRFNSDKIYTPAEGPTPINAAACSSLWSHQSALPCEFVSFYFGFKRFTHHSHIWWQTEKRLKEGTFRPDPPASLIGPHSVCGPQRWGVDFITFF